jgi:hypothetical protein
MATVTTVVENVRGCGFRKPGGIYLVSDGLFAPCGRLPIPLVTCPCCSQGIKPSRGWTWVNLPLLLTNSPECSLGRDCAGCPLNSGALNQCGLLWVGGQFYKSPEEFTLEAARQGVSRRIAAVPRGFKVGQTWVLLAHREALPNPDGEGKIPAIFHAFLPTRIEYVVKGTETEEELDALEKRGFTLVKVEKAGETMPLPLYN